MMGTIYHLVKKEFLQFVRTRSMIVVTLGVPVIQLLVLGFAISGDIEHIPTVITDLDNSASSRDIIDMLDTSRYLHIDRVFTSPGHGMPLLVRGEAILSVTIPADFHRDLVGGMRPSIQVQADAQNTTVALTGTGYVRRMLTEWSISEKQPAEHPGTALSYITTEPRVWYNPELKSVYYMVPGILVLLVTVVTVILTSMAIVREREIGTLEQLMVTPITKSQLILGKTIPFALVGMVELMLALGMAVAVYDIRIAGSLPLFFALSLIYVFCTLGIGILISTVVHTQQQALFTAWFFLIFFILMSGFFLSIESMPDILYSLTYLNPLRYYMTIVRDLFLKGAGIGELYEEGVALVVIAGVIITAAVVRFRKRMD